MKQYYLKIQSKNEKSLKNFLYFFFKHLNSQFNVVQKLNVTKTKRKVITFLTSPHVNKTAQEHFESHIFSKKLLVRGFFLEKSFIFFKRVLARLFQDILIHLEILNNEKVKTKINLPLFDSNYLRSLTAKVLKTNLKRDRQKVIAQNFEKKKSHLVYLTRSLTTISLFGEIITVSSLKQ